VLRNLKEGLKEFDRDRVLDCLQRYGSSSAKRTLKEAYA
jgi:hypothetical protein